MATRDRPSFEEMCRAFPIRTGLFTFGPLAVGAAQSLNAVAHGTNLWLVAIIAIATVVYSVLVTNYHLASFRRRTICRGIE
ncbi:hypothetical protein ACFQMA_25310 [Halosimplex aquaticum]|uniref:Tellurite resistance protein TehA n=1 Tax=Halosimplex aquaticum TaxID=3026162 RepID=A0ABD5Y9V2_9EURY